MQTALLLAAKTGSLALIVLMGWALVKTKLLQSHDSRPFSVASLYLISPAVMLHAFQIPRTDETVRGLLLSVAMAVLFHILLLLCGRLFKRLFDLDPVEHAAAVYSNSGNLIIPLVMSIFGPQWVVYTTGFIVVQNLLFWTHLRSLLGGTRRIPWKSLLLNINILSIAAGMLMFFSGIRLPAPVDDALASVGSMIGPVAMLVAGMLIAPMPFKQLAASRRIYLVAFLRLILTPLLLLLAVKILGFAHTDPHGRTVVLISFLATVSPAAATVTHMALTYGGNAEKSGAIYGMTTLLCVLTMPVMIWLYQWLI